MLDIDKLQLPDFGMVGADVDFDLSDFNVISDKTPVGAQGEAQEGSHILKPRIAARDVLHTVTFECAELFAEQVELSPGARTYAWVNGNFIFGDLIEALWEHRGVDIKELYICSLSLSQENIDSLHNILEFSNVQRISLVLSGYFYSMEKYKLIPYLYEQLDNPRVQIAFGAYHGKVFSIETYLGHYITCHGSANLRSSNSIEQICLENDKALHEFNAKILGNICDTYGVFNHKIKPRMDEQASWEALTQGVD